MFRASKATIATAVALGGLALSPVVASALPMIDTTPAVVAHSTEGSGVVEAYWHRGWHRPWGWRRHWGWHHPRHRHW